MDVVGSDVVVDVAGMDVAGVDVAGAHAVSTISNSEIRMTHDARSTVRARGNGDSSLCRLSIDEPTASAPVRITSPRVSASGIALSSSIGGIAESMREHDLKPEVLMQHFAAQQVAPSKVTVFKEVLISYVLPGKMPACISWGLMAHVRPVTTAHDRYSKKNCLIF